MASEEMKKEIGVLYRLGASLEEIEYLLKAKFKKAIPQKKLVSLLFSIV